MRIQQQDYPLVLVADDEVSAAMMLRHIFEHEGYRVEIAENGIAAYQMARELQPDLIILDIMMPEMNGFEVLKKLREEPATDGIPTIVVSARAKEPDDVAKGLNIGADDYLPKPFAPQELLARARAKMRAKQLEEALQRRTDELETLLRVSEELSRHLEVEELLSLILQLSLDLLPGEYAMICQLDDDGTVSAYRTETRGDLNIADPTHPLLEAIQDGLREHYVDVQDTDPWIGFQNAMLIPMEHGDQQLGVIMIGSYNAPFDDNHHMLLKGISRQAALALHNAELYEIQANYAVHLEDMVAQRTEELKETQHMLLRSEKLASIGHLAANIAHEINNPLQPIQLNLEFLMEEAQSGGTVDHEIITMTQNSVERISRIVRQLLEFTKSGNDQSFTAVDIAQTLESVIKLNERTFLRDDIEIVTEIAPALKTMANKDQLEQVFMNLMINAKAAIDKHGRMIVRAWQEANKIRIQFEDTGSGIPEDLIDKIFDPFVSTKPEGTGLGLFVTYGIIESHQGEIDVKSKVGNGTTFTITLPVN